MARVLLSEARFHGAKIRGVLATAILNDTQLTTAEEVCYGIGTK